MYQKNGVLKGLCVFLLLSYAAVGQWDFHATLTGSAEVPPNDSTAFGTATLTLNAQQTRLTMHLTLFGLHLDNVTGLHIHNAPVGVNGPVVFGMIGPNHDLNDDLVIDAVAGTVFSAWDVGEGADLANHLGNLFAGNLYFNVHTPAFPPGEIRGQIVPEPATVTLMLLGGLGLLRKRRCAV